MILSDSIVLQFTLPQKTSGMKIVFIKLEKKNPTTQDCQVTIWTFIYQVD